MKKIAISALVLGLAYVGGAYFTGYLGEQKMREQLALSQAQSASSGLIMVLEHYERGIFSSDVALTLKSANSLALFNNNMEVSVNTQLQHGPVLFKQGFGLGLFSAITRIMVHTHDADTDKKITDFFGESIGEIYTQAGFSNTYTARWLLPAKKVEEGSYNLSFAESSVDMQGRFDSLSTKGEIHLGAMELLSADGSEVKMSPAEGSFDSTNLAAGINIANANIHVDEINITTAAGVKLFVKQLGYEQKQSVVNESIDTSVALTLAEVSGPVSASNAYYKVDMNQLNIAALKAWGEGMSVLPSDPLALNTFYMEQLKRLAPQFLQPGLSFTFAMGADFMGGKPQAHWTLNYQPPAAGTNVADMSEPFEYLSLADSQLEVRLPEVVAMGLPMLTLMDSYITKEAGEYVLKATLHNSELFVGDTQIPTETVLMVLSGIGAKQNAAQDAQLQQTIDSADDEAEDIDDELEEESAGSTAAE